MMMNSLKKMIAVVIVFTMISGALLIMVPQAGESSVPDELPYADQIPIYADENMRKRGVNELSTEFIDMSMISPLVENDPINTTKLFLASGLLWSPSRGEYVDSLYFEEMMKRGEGNHCEVWVATDLNFPEGDPRNDRVNITDDMVDYIMAEYDNEIYPTMTETFMDAPALNGSDPYMPNWQYIFDDDTLTKENISDFPGLFETNDTGKLMIMIFNMKDDSFYDPDYTGGYIAGYYWSTIRWMYDRNVMHIDCWDWANRTGPQSDIPGSGHYSYVYESTVAHEYQHLLHYEMDGAEESWINEGLSMMAEYLCGYPLSYSHMAWFMATPDNSLTIWGDQGDLNILADYGCVAMFQLFLYDNYGGTEMMQAVFNSQLQGMESIDDALLSMGYNRMNFNKLFRDWRLANLALQLNDDLLPTGVHTYKSISWWSIGQELKILDRSTMGDYFECASLWYGDTITKEGDSIGRSSMDAYGTDYIYVHGMNLDVNDILTSLYFDGSDLSEEGWMYDGMWQEWWSGTGDEKDYLLTMEVDLTQPAGEEGDYLHWLNISTWWDIEDNWDFGFVQVSTDGGETWTSLNDTGELFTEEHDADAMPSIAENLPGLTSWPGDYMYHDIAFDLSAYDGMEIMVGFRYMTDWATSYSGWYIDGVSVDGVEQNLLAMTPVYPEMDWMVTIYLPGNMYRMPMIIDVPTHDLEETATLLMGSLMGYDRMYILLSNDGNVGSWYMEMNNDGRFRPTR
ncbi:Immune inhibitor A peptidase M6 [anaerobic digester metagenome]